MQTPIATIKRYIQDTLGLTVDPVPWRGQDRLPFMLQDRYAFHTVQMLGTPCILMMDAGGEEQSPATVQKHIVLVRAHADGEVIYVRDRITAYNRKRLIEHRVPFIVSGNQMYLPMIGIDLREHFRKLCSDLPQFSPSTQAMFISWLLSGDNRAFTPSEMAARLEYSPMTMTRAFDELESARMGEFTTRGRERFLAFSEPESELWSRAQTFLRSPVQHRVHLRAVAELPHGVRAGLTALAHYTMLAEPGRPVFAVGNRAWKTIRRKYDRHTVPSQEEDAYEVEIWNYDPFLFAENGYADCLSLYLSLRESRDERVEAALAEMMRGLRW